MLRYEIFKYFYLYLQFTSEIRHEHNKTDMKKVLTIFAAAVCAALVYSCTEDQPQITLPTATLSADEAFVDGKANITLTLSAAAPVDVTATLAYGQAREGKTAIELAALKFDEKVTLKAGEKTATATVELISTENIADGAEAPIALAAISTEELGSLKCDVAIAYIAYKAGNYGDNNNPEDPNKPDDPNNPNYPVEGLSVLDWTVAYTGTQWVEGYYSYGQLEVFEISNTDVTKYYYPMLVDVAEDGSFKDILADADLGAAFFAELQAEIDEAIADDMERYGDTLEEALYWTLYNEENDGPTYLTDGLTVGNYQLVIFSVDGTNAQLDKGYKILEFAKASDAALYYDYGFNPTLNRSWVLNWEEWLFQPYYCYLQGYAPGAAYVITDIADEETIATYYEGELVNILNYYQAIINDALADGENTIEDLVDAGYLAEVDEDGYFEDAIGYGEGTYILIGVDATGKVMNDYIRAEIEAEVIEWTPRADWAANYDETVDTGYEDYPQAIVVTACDAPYFEVKVFESGVVANYGMDAVAQAIGGDWTGYLDDETTMDDWVEDGYVGNAVPFVYPVYGLTLGYEVVVIGYNADGTFSGDYHVEELVGLPEPVEPEVQADWSIELLEPFTSSNKLYYYVKVNAPDIKYFDMEEDTDEDLEELYDGKVSILIGAFADEFQGYVASGYTMAECAWTLEDEPYFRVWNTDTPTKVYLMEFDENGRSTGRYGVTELTIPSPDAGTAPNKAVLKVTAKQDKTVVKDFSTLKSGKPAKKAAKAVKSFDPEKGAKMHERHQGAKVIKQHHR